MKRKLTSTIIALVIGLVCTDVFAQKESVLEKKESALEKKNLADSNRVISNTMVISSNMVAPPNQTFYVYDENKKLVGTYKEGTTVIVPETKAKKKKKLDCAKVPCPSTFRKGTTCWECH